MKVDFQNEIMILSGLFWPTLNKEQFKMSPLINDYLEVYSKQVCVI
jgi:hypothetical protein